MTTLLRRTTRLASRLTRMPALLRHFDDWAAREDDSSSIPWSPPEGFKEMPLPPKDSCDWVVGGGSGGGDDTDRITCRLAFCAERSELQGVVRFGKNTMGPPGLVHGGATATVADACLALVPYWSKQWAVTAKLSVDYEKPVALLSTVHVRAGFSSLSLTPEGLAEVEPPLEPPLDRPKGPGRRLGQEGVRNTTSSSERRFATTDDELATIATKRKKPVSFVMSRMGDDGQPVGPPLISASAVCVVPRGGVANLHETA